MALGILKKIPIYPIFYLLKRDYIFWEATSTQLYVRYLDLNHD